MILGRPLRIVTAVLLLACLVLAIVNAPALPVVIFYGFPTWLGGCCLTLLAQHYLGRKP